MLDDNVVVVFKFDDNDLREAAELVRQVMIESINTADKPRHVFSDGFEAKIKELISFERKKQIKRRILRQVVAAILVAVFGATIWLGIDVEARTAVFQWAREVYESTIIYRFFGDHSKTELPDCTPRWLPDDFSEADRYITNDLADFYYVNETTGQVLCYTYQALYIGSQIEIDPDGSQKESVEVNGKPGDYYPASPSGNDSNGIVWIDEENELVFSIISDLDKDTILKIAENIRVTN